MSSFNFTWKETVTKNLSVPENEMDGLSVLYEPTGGTGEVTMVGDRLAIIWEDCADTTFLDTNRGIEILKECMPL